MIPLPIDSVLPSVGESLRTHGSVILSAPPGSGKTTRVAPFLLSHLPPKERVFLLQPRRVAARGAAQRIADEQGWGLGQEVGYQVRFESRWNRGTRLIVATEGILLRRIQQDPTLAEVGMVVLDEFHERSLIADCVLGMLRRIQMAIRPDLKIVVMSATIATDELSSYLESAPIIRAEGQAYPVEIRYRPVPSRTHWLDHCQETIEWTMSRTEQSILVFLPGVGEIRRLHDSLRKQKHAGWDVVALHGSLSLEEQSRIVAGGVRPQVVLATNVAETSLTLSGIGTVIDTGWARVARLDPQSGLDRLELEPICMASADQRAGRAGRTQRGVCVRLWDEAASGSRPAYLEPEIQRVDLSGMLLQLFEWGEGDGRDFPWFQSPREDATRSGLLQLQRLGAIADHRITNLGRAMAHLPVSPRLARMLLEGVQYQCLSEVAELVAMLSERDPFVSDRPASGRNVPTRAIGRWDSDVVERWKAIRAYWDGSDAPTPWGSVHRQAVATLRETARQLERETRQAIEEDALAFPERVSSEEVEVRLMRCLGVGFADRLAKRRQAHQPRGLMVGGRGICLGPTSGVTEPELFVCVDVHGSGPDATVRQASRVDESWLPEELISIRDKLFFHPTQKQVVARRQRFWDDLLLSETPVPIVDQVEAQEVLFEAACQHWEQSVPNDSDLADWIERIACFREWLPERDLPPLDQDGLKEIMKLICHGKRSLAEIQQASWIDWIRQRYTSEQWQWIEKEVPERIRVPSGSAIRIQYARGKPPILAVRIQEVFSWKTTPRIACGRVPLLLHLLAPNMRPQQITDDLKSFWENTYSIVKKELKRRYPKHAWPDDPWNAMPVKKG